MGYRPENKHQQHQLTLIPESHPLNPRIPIPHILFLLTFVVSAVLFFLPPIHISITALAFIGLLGIGTYVGYVYNPNKIPATMILGTICGCLVHWTPCLYIPQHATEIPLLVLQPENLP